MLDFGPISTPPTILSRPGQGGEGWEAFHKSLSLCVLFGHVHLVRQPSSLH